MYQFNNIFCDWLLYPLFNLDGRYDYALVPGFPGAQTYVGVNADGSLAWTEDHPLGKYFVFDLTEWTNYFETFSAGQKLYVNQCHNGQRVGSGHVRIVVWEPNPSLYHGYVGRRESGPAGG